MNRLHIWCPSSTHASKDEDGRHAKSGFIYTDTCRVKSDNLDQEVIWAIQYKIRSSMNFLRSTVSIYSQLIAYSSSYISCSVCAMKIEAGLPYTTLLKQSCQVVMMHMSEMSLKNA